MASGAPTQPQSGGGAKPRLQCAAAPTRACKHACCTLSTRVARCMHVAHMLHVVCALHTEQACCTSHAASWLHMEDTRCTQLHVAHPARVQMACCTLSTRFACFNCMLHAEHTAARFLCTLSTQLCTLLAHCTLSTQLHAGCALCSLHTAAPPPRPLSFPALHSLLFFPPPLPAAHNENQTLPTPQLGAAPHRAALRRLLASPRPSCPCVAIP